MMTQQYDNTYIAISFSKTRTSSNKNDDDKSTTIIVHQMVSDIIIS